jgi:futalosine hydrolase
MNVLIVAATKLEIEPFLKEKTTADVLITGVGITATTFHLTKKLFDKKYGAVLNLGIAGTFNSTFQLGQVFFVKADTFADLGIEENGKFQTLFESGFINRNDFPYSNGWLVNDNPLLGKNDVPVAKAVTVNKLSDNPLQNQFTKEKFSADIESMEGAAFHYVCLREGISFLQMRAISNFVGERDKSKWEIKKAIENLNKELLKLLKNYN